MAQSNYCVFYTEDDPDDQALFKDALKRIDSNIELHIQNDGVELMKKLDNPPPRPAILFLDLNMPKKNGMEVLQELNASAKYQDLKVIIFTTSDDAETIKRTKNLGADLFVTKPQSYNNFISAIRHCLTMDWSTFKVNNTSFALSFK